MGWVILEAGVVATLKRMRDSKSGLTLSLDTSVCRDNLLKLHQSLQGGRLLSGTRILDVGCGGGLLSEVRSVLCGCIRALR